MQSVHSKNEVSGFSPPRKKSLHESKLTETEDSDVVPDNKYLSPNKRKILNYENKINELEATIKGLLNEKKRDTAFQKLLSENSDSKGGPFASDTRL